MAENELGQIVEGLKDDGEIKPFNNLVTPNVSFDFTAPTPLASGPKFGAGDVFGSAWHLGATGGIIDAGKKESRFREFREADTQLAFDDSDRDPSETYRFIMDVPDRYLYSDFLPHFARAQSAEEVNYIASELNNDEHYRSVRQERPWAYFGASILADPIWFAVPAAKGGQALKSAYTAKVAGETAKRAAAEAGREVLKSARAGAVTFGLTEAATSAIQHQARVSKDIGESVFDTAAAAFLGGALGAVGSSLLGVAGYKYSHSNVVNALADIPDTPTVPLKSKVFVMGPVKTEIAKANDKIANVPDSVVKGIISGDLNKMMTSDFPTENYTAQLLYSHGFVTTKNIVDGLPNPVNIEDEIWRSLQGFQPTMVKFDKMFREQLGVTGDTGAGVRSRIANEFNKGAMNVEENHIAVAMALDSAQVSPNPTVAAQVDLIRKEVFKPVLERLVAVDKMHPKFLEPEFEPYFHRMFKESLVQRDVNGFKSMLTDFYKETNDWYKGNADRVAFLKKPADETSLKIKKNEDKIDQIRFKQSERINKKLTNKEMGELDKLKNTVKKLKKELEVQMGTLYDFIPSKYIPLDGHIPNPKDDLTLSESAWNTTLKILNQQREQGSNFLNSGATGQPNPMMARALKIPNDFKSQIIDSDGTVREISVFDFIEKDIHKVASNYLRKTVPVAVFEEQAKVNGFKSFDDMKAFLMENLEQEFKFNVKGKKGRESAKISKAHKDAINRIERAIETLAFRTSHQNVKGEKILRKLNEYTDKRLLGSATLSSVADAATSVVRQNFDSFVYDSILPNLQSIVTLSRNSAKLANRQEAKEFGLGIETIIGQRMKAIIDNADLLIPNKFWGRATDTIGGPFNNANLMNQFMDDVSQMAYHRSVSKSIRTIFHKFESGKISKRNDRRLLAIGISKESQKEIYDMWKEAAKLRPSEAKDGTVFSPLTSDWNISTPERAQANMEWRNATTRDVRQSFLKTTAGDRLPGSDNFYFKTMLKFKDYLIASHNKILLQAAQKIGSRELDVFFGLTYLLSLGSLSYVMTSLAKDPTGESLDLSPGNLFREAIDRSGAGGLPMEMTNLFAKTGWLPVGPTTRWESRGMFGSVLGPTGGLIDDSLIAGGSMMASQLWGTKELKQSDVLRILRLLPYQNIFYLRYLNETMAKNFATAIGAEE